MTAKLSKEVTDRMREGRWVLSAFEVEGPSVAAGFAGVTEPHLEDGDEEPRPGAFVVSLGRTLGSALDHLVSKDFAVSEAAARESALRGERKADKRQLGFLIVAFRHTVIGQYEAPDLDNLGLQPLEARDSITVSRRGELIGQRFEAPNVPELLGKPRFKKPVNVQQHVDEIRTNSAELLALAEEIDKAHRATARARIERDKAKEEYDRVCLRACRMFEDHCRFAGRDDLAARIRSSASRPRGMEETPEKEGDPVAGGSIELQPGEVMSRSNHREDEEDFAALLAEFESERADPKIGEKVRGTIVAIGDEIAFVDLGAKAEGTVDRGELADADGRLTVAVGDEIEALVAAVDESGNLVLRVRPGHGEAMRSELELAWKEQLPVEGTVSAEVKGGVEVTVGGRRAFCPVSQLDRRYVADPGEFVGQKLEFRIRTFEESGHRLNIVLSRRVLLDEEAERRAAALRQRLEVGSVHEGTVTSLTSYGAFVDLGGLEGLLHVSEMSYRRGIDPREVLREGQRLEVKVVAVEPAKKPGGTERISLSTKALERDPWEGVERRFPAGTKVSGLVTRLEPYGAFVELEPGLEGLVHISRLGGRGGERHAREMVELGQTLDVRVVEVEPERRRIALAREVDEPTDEERRDVEAFQRSSSEAEGFGSLGDFFKKTRKD